MQLKVICLCYVPTSTLGDLRTLIVNMRLLKKRYSNEIGLHLIVVMLKNNKRIIPTIKKLIPEELSYDILFLEDLLKMVNADQALIGIHNKFKDSDRIFICPNAHFLPARAYKEISRFNKPTILCTEYNFQCCPNLWKFYKSGWQEGDNPYVVFPPAFDCFLTMGILTKHKEMHGIFLPTVELEDRPLSNLTTVDGVKLKKFFIPSQTEEVYHQSHDLYFGYFNQSTSEDLSQCLGQTLESPLEYIRLCLIKSKFKRSETQRVIDIVVPLKRERSLYSFEALMEVLRKINPLLDQVYCFEYYEKDENEVLHCTSEAGEGQQRVRIINPFPICEQSMAALFKASDPFCLVTGDQSLSEALGHRKIPFYQTMKWKLFLKYDLIDSVERVLGKDSLLNQYFQACATKNIPGLLKLICENEAALLESLNQYVDYLYQHENAEGKYIDKLARLILDDAEFAIQVKSQARARPREFLYKVQNFSRVYSTEKYLDSLVKLQDVVLEVGFDPIMDAIQKNNLELLERLLLCPGFEQSSHRSHIEILRKVKARPEGVPTFTVQYVLKNQDEWYIRIESVKGYTLNEQLAEIEEMLGKFGYVNTFELKKYADGKESIEIFIDPDELCEAFQKVKIKPR